MAAEGWRCAGGGLAVGGLGSLVRGQRGGQHRQGFVVAPQAGQRVGQMALHAALGKLELTPALMPGQRLLQQWQTQGRAAFG